MSLQRLNLTISKKPVPAHATVELNARRLKRWLAELPYENVTETIAAINVVLAGLNNASLEHDERVKLLECFRECAEQILFAYDDIKLRSLSVTPEQRGEIAQQIVTFFLGVADGYKTIANAAQPTANDTNGDAQWMLSLYRSIDYLSLSQLYSSKVRADVPKNTWHEIKQIFAYAESCDLLTTNIRGIKDHAAAPTLENIVKHAALFSIADPSKWSSDDLQLLYVALEPFSAYAVVTQSATDRIHNCAFSIADDTAPRGDPLSESDVDLSVIRFIDTQPTLTAIDEWLKTNDTGDTFLASQERRVLAEFVKRMRAPRARPKPRRIAKAALGIDAVVYYLSDVGRIESTNAPVTQGGIEVQELDDDYRPEYDLTDWRIIDDSTYDHLLISESTKLPRNATVGDIIGLIETSARNTSLRVAIARSVRSDKAGITRIGIELLPEVCTVARCTWNADGVDECQFTALYFASERGVPPLLLLPRPYYAPAERISIEMHGVVEHCDLDLVIKETPTHVIAAAFVPSQAVKSVA